jgi:Protein of unknown function (DUF4229)
VNPFVKYTLWRIALFLGVLLILLPVPRLGLLVKALIAVVVSFGLSLVLMRRWRSELNAYLAERAERRQEEQRRLRDTLYGEDTPDQDGPGEEPGAR